MSEEKTQTNGSRSTGTVARAIRMLGAVVDAAGPVGINALGEATGLPASTTHRLLGLLVEEGMVVHNPALHSYQVGPEWYRIAARTVESVGLDRIVQPVLQKLADRFDETVLFGQYSPTGGNLAFLCRADGDHLLQYRIELHAPNSLLWGASGKAVSAFLEPDTVAAVYDAERSGPRAGRAVADDSELPPLAELEQELAEIRRDGWAGTRGEKLPAARGIAVPVFGPRGVVGSLTLTHPKERTPHGDVETIVVDLQAAARAIGRYLGLPDGDDS